MMNIDKAVKLHNFGDHEAAILNYDLAFSNFENDINSLCGKAGALIALRRYKEAMAIYVYLSVMNPDLELDYFTLKNGVKTEVIKRNDKQLLQYMLNALWKIHSNLSVKYHVLDFISELQPLKGRLDEAVQTKYRATKLYAQSLFDKSLDFAEKGKVPDFYVIGPQKTATTALFNFISDSPDVIPSLNKEIFYLNGDNYKLGKEFYESHFAGVTNIRKVVGEATATYFNSPLVPKRMNDWVPDAKLIFTIRNPIDRALSDYYMQRRMGYEKLGVVEAITNEVNFLGKGDILENFESPGYYKAGCKGYVRNGLYEIYLNRYKKYFNEKQLLVIKSEDLRDSKHKFIESCNFVGVTAPEYDPTSKKVNVAEYEKDDAYYEARLILQEFYSENKQFVGTEY